MLRVPLAALALVLAAASAPAAGQAEAQPGPLVVYTRTGGLIGVQDSMRVSPTGTVSSTNGNFRLSAKRLATLRERLRAARFPSLKRVYGTPVADGFVYGVTYRGRKVLVNENAEAPLRLRRVLQLVREIFGRRG